MRERERVSDVWRHGEALLGHCLMNLSWLVMPMVDICDSNWCWAGLDAFIISYYGLVWLLLFMPSCLFIFDIHDKLCFIYAALLDCW